MTYIYVLMACIAFIIGIIVGKVINIPDGIIIIDKNQDGDDRITFNLGLELDDLLNYKHILFKVVKK